MSKESAAEGDPEKRGADAATTMEDLLVAALDALSSEGEEGIERLLAMHPAEAPRLRTHLNRLHQYGFVPAAPSAEGEMPALRGEFPERLGGFRLLVRIGGGGMGVVFLAEQENLGRRVALKLMRTEQLYFPGARQRFEREVESIARLQHPSIVPVHAAGEDGGVPWLAMDYVAGASLDEVLAQLQGRDPARLRGADLAAAIAAQCAARPASLRSLTEELQAREKKSTAVEEAKAALFSGSWSTACLRIARAVAEALAHAHARGVLHRDIKPSNVMITPGGSVLLLDFGLARHEGAAKLTGTNSLLGSPAYMSPEQVRGEREIDARSDVYSLGVTLYELFTLHTPYVGENVEATRRAVLAGNPKPLRHFHSALPRDAEVVCKKAMMPEVGARYADMAAFAGDLANALELRPITARPPSAVLIAKRWAQRHPARAVFLAALFLLLSVVPTGFLIQERAANQRIKSALAVARTNRDRALEAIDVLLMRVASEELFQVPRMANVRRSLLKSAGEFYERFLAENEADPELQEATSKAAIHLGMVDAELGNGQEAIASAQRAVKFARAFHASEESGTDSRILLAMALGSLGATLHGQAHYEEGLAAIEESIALDRITIDQDPGDLECVVRLLGNERSRIFYHSRLGNFEAAIDGYAAIAELWKELWGDVAATAHSGRAFDHVLGACADEAMLLIRLERMAEAGACIARSVELVGYVRGRDYGDIAHLALVRLDIARSKLAEADQDLSGAEFYLREARAGLKPILDHSPDLANARRVLANVNNDLALLLNRDASTREEALDLMRASISELRTLIDLDPLSVEPRGNVAISLVNLASYLKEALKPEEARIALEEALPLLREVCEKDPANSVWPEATFNGLWFLSLVESDLQRFERSVAAAEQLVRWDPENPRVLRIASGLIANAAMSIENDARRDAVARARDAQQLYRRAFACLKAAAEKGCADLDWVRDARELEAVRDMEGFDDVWKQLEQNAK